MVTTVHVYWIVCDSRTRAHGLMCSRCVVRSQPIVSSEYVECRRTLPIVYLDFTDSLKRLFFVIFFSFTRRQTHMDQGNMYYREVLAHPGSPGQSLGGRNTVVVFVIFSFTC